jgi:hypothetical protein
LAVLEGTIPIELWPPKTVKSILEFGPSNRDTIVAATPELAPELAQAARD